MTGYFVETLTPLGWKRPNVVHFRYRDALAHATERLEDGPIRAVRILPFKVSDEPVYSAERDDTPSLKEVY